jgi:uncharacterized OB-fold protein
MDMNNAVTDWREKVIGYRCFECGAVVQSMWRTTCNNCRAKHNEAEKTRNEIRLLREEIAKLKTNK